MSEQQQVPPISINSTWRVIFAIVGLLFFSTIIVYLILYGNKDNSLHQSALAWSFLCDVGILAALGIGQIAEYIPYIFTKK